MKSQSRRAVRFGSLFLAMVLVLAACDSGESTDTTTGGTGGEARWRAGRAPGVGIP